jgi:hypothetical protein
MVFFLREQQFERNITGRLIMIPPLVFDVPTQIISTCTDKKSQEILSHSSGNLEGIERTVG